MKLLPFATSLLLCAPAVARQPGEAPAGDRPAHIDHAGTTVLPSGRLITPVGKRIVTAPHPFGLVLSPDGKTLVSSNSGNGPFCITVVTDLAAPRPKAVQYPPGVSDDPNPLASVFMGLAFAKDSRTLYVSGGDDGTIHVFDTHTGEHPTIIATNDDRYKHAYTGDLALSPDGTSLYAVDQANFRLIVVDTATNKVRTSVPVGRYPFAVTVTPDGKKVFVANVGMYEYRPIEGGTLPYPPFGVPSREAEEGVEIDGKKAPGLGKPNVPESFSVWTVDVSDPGAPKVTAKVKTGTLVGEVTHMDFPAVGGSSPNSLVASPTRVYVTNGNNDNVQILDSATSKVFATIPLGPLAGVKQRGVLPFGLALSPDGHRLYVAEAGINAVAVIDTLKKKVLGHIPAGWYPSKVQVSPDGKTLYVASAKGFGAGPNGGPDFKPGPEGSYVGALMKGLLTILPVPSDKELPALTARVLENNGFPPKADEKKLAALRKVIRHVVYITKENRTFDEMFGDFPGANGVPSMARFGVDATVRQNGQPTLEHVNVAPNHRALATRYAMSDNFYADGDVSADGHRWLVGIYPNEWAETQFAAGYGGKAGFRTDTPGRRAFFGSNASSFPEDYNEAGSIFDHLDRNGITFRNYGEGFEFAGVRQEPDTEPTGARETLNIPMTKPLFDNTSREYPIFNMMIPDQYRAMQFLKDLARWEKGDEPMPHYLNITLPNDHMAGARADDGYPYTTSYIADNDLALGRIVEGLSRSKFWKSMVVFVTEDDAQSGVDHVDAHRTILLAAGPYIKRGYISHRHGSLPSVTNTMNRLFGLPALNQFDATASDLLDMFTLEPDTAPYTALPVDPRLFDPTKAKWGAIPAGSDDNPRLDDPRFLRREHEEHDARVEESSP